MIKLIILNERKSFLYFELEGRLLNEEMNKKNNKSKNKFKALDVTYTQDICCSYN